MDIKELAVKHDYHCSESNYYSNKPSKRYDTATEFLDEFENTDIDMNLVFRFDVHNKRDEETDIETGEYWAEVFLMLQRKGIFMPCHIVSIKQDEVDRFVSYLKKHKEKLNSIWSPLE